MREMFNQHGEAIIGACTAILVMGSIAGIVFGGGFSAAARYFSSWLYG